MSNEPKALKLSQRILANPNDYCYAHQHSQEVAALEAELEAEKDSVKYWREALYKQNEECARLGNNSRLFSKERDDAYKDLARLREENARLRSAVKQQQIRLTDLFDRHERPTYHENSNPDEDLKLLLADGEAALKQDSR